MSNEEAMEEAVTYYVFVRDGRRHFAPQQLLVGVTDIDWIFPVPEPNAVGTLDEHSNGIVFITFGDYGAEPKSKVVAKDYCETGINLFYYRFSPNYTDDTIVYSQDYHVIIANVKTGEAYCIKCDGLNNNGDNLLGVRFLDPQKNIFVIVKSLISSRRYMLEDHLHVAKLDGQKFVDTGWTMKIRRNEQNRLYDFPRHNMWYVHDRKLFVYDEERHKIVCTDGNVLASHPFSENFNVNSTLIYEVKDIAIHPKLPFGAIITEDAYKNYDIVVLRWDMLKPKKKFKQVISFGRYIEPLKDLFGMNQMRFVYQSFAPNGNWYVVGCLGPEYSLSPYFIAIPVVHVDKRHPYFFDIDNLVVLGQVMDMTTIAWTHEPTSYVVSNGENLYKWDLDELPNARVFEVPNDGAGEGKASVFRRIARWFGLWR